MGQISTKLRSVAGEFSYWCQGCEEMHCVNSGWTFDGNLEAPTFSPSVLVTSGHYIAGWQGPSCWCTYNAERPGNPSPFKCERCHTFIKNGMVQFLSDCTHTLAGQTLPLPDLPSHVRDNFSEISGLTMKSYFKVVAFGILFGIIMGALLGSTRSARSRDAGQWEATDPAIREWYQSLMQPDVPSASCCGEADAYWADEIHVRDGKTYAKITDDRPDEPRGRPHVEIGTEFLIPDNKLKWDRGNPEGHAVIFLSRSGYVFCFVQSGGT